MCDADLNKVAIEKGRAQLAHITSGALAQLLSCIRHDIHAQLQEACHIALKFGDCGLRLEGLEGRDVGVEIPARSC